MVEIYDILIYKILRPVVEVRQIKEYCVETELPEAVPKLIYKEIQSGRDWGPFQRQNRRRQ